MKEEIKNRIIKESREYFRDSHNMVHVNPIVEDWWLSKIDEALKSQREEVEEVLKSQREEVEEVLKSQREEVESHFHELKSKIDNAFYEMSKEIK